MTGIPPPTATVRAAMRKERIERLLHELEYEVTRGVMEEEISESLTYRFVLQSTWTGVAGFLLGEFRLMPARPHEVP